MTFSFNPACGRGLDTMLLVYSVLQGHPAAMPCEQFLRAHSGWFTSSFVLAEAKNILTKVYSVSAWDWRQRRTREIAYSTADSAAG